MDSKAKNGAGAIEKFCKNGDVININNHPKWWQIWLHIVLYFIRNTQRKIFRDPDLIDAFIDGILKRFNANNDTHTMLYFKNESIINNIGANEKIQKLLNKHPDITTFSVEPPKALFVPNTDFSGLDIAVYRYCGKRIDERDVRIMLQATLPIIGTWYDFGQLLSTLVDVVAGYPNVEKDKTFDFGAKYHYCSSGVAAVYANWRHELEKMGVNLARLFSILNPPKWNDKFIEEFNITKKWFVERTYPANFSNCEHFNDDFRLVMKLFNGEIVYLTT